MTDGSEDRIPLRPVPDLRGLPVADAGGRPIGQLFGALIEDDTGLLRYLDLSLDDERRHILVPIGHARIHETNDRPEVRLRAVVLDDLRGIPTYAPATPALEDGYERELIAAYGRSFYGDRYYAHPAFDHSRLYAGEHPIVPAHEHVEHVEHAEAAPPPAPRAATLALLSQRPDYRIARGEPDIVGWPVRTEAHLPSGMVTDLVIDPGEEQVRYAVVDVADGEGAVLLPVGFLQIERRSSSVRAPGLRHDDLASLPRFSQGEIERDLEERVRETLRNRMLDRRRYALPEFREGIVKDRRRG
ncbi:MAG: PRC-barrel domain-containing protein [Longimicrobiales bacterium]